MHPFLAFHPQVVLKYSLSRYHTWMQVPVCSRHKLQDSAQRLAGIWDTLVMGSIFSGQPMLTYRKTETKPGMNIFLFIKFNASVLRFTREKYVLNAKSVCFSGRSIQRSFDFQLMYDVINWLDCAQAYFCSALCLSQLKKKDKKMGNGVSHYVCAGLKHDNSFPAPITSHFKAARWKSDKMWNPFMENRWK